MARARNVRTSSVTKRSGVERMRPRMATRDGPRDGIALTKRKRSGSENADRLRRNKEKKRRFAPFPPTKLFFLIHRRKRSMATRGKRATAPM